MYSLSGRLNVITFNTLIALTVLSAMNYLSVFLNKGEPRDIKFNLIDFDTFVADKYINEDALSFNFDLQADLEPLFNWNTNIVFLSLSCEYNTSKSDFNKVTFWDQRIPRTDVKNHKLKLSREYPEYYITDVNKNLRNQEVEVYLNWEQMPIVGANFGGKVLIGTFSTPKNYISGSRRKFKPGPERRAENY